MPKVDGKIFHLSPITPIFKVQTESLPVRCDVCHQSDCFDPLKNYCTRCHNLATTAVIKEPVTIPTPISANTNNFNAGMMGAAIGIGVDVLLTFIFIILGLHEDGPIPFFLIFGILNVLIGVTTASTNEKYLSRIYPGEINFTVLWITCTGISIIGGGVSLFLLALTVSFLLINGIFFAQCIGALFLGMILGGLNGALNSIPLIQHKIQSSRISN